jgi:type I restriction enzyme S subunit
VIGRVGARCGCVFVTEPKFWVTDNALLLTEISPDLDEYYLVHALTTLDLRQQANQAAQPVVSQKRINPMRIPVPPPGEQRRIVAYLGDLQKQTDALKVLQNETSRELDALMPSILDKAFRGEL